MTRVLALGRKVISHRKFTWGDERTPKYMERADEGLEVFGLEESSDTKRTISVAAVLK